MLYRVVGVAGLLTLVACSGVDTVTIAEAEHAAIEQDDATSESAVVPEVMHELQVGDERIEFIALSLDGEPAGLLFRSAFPTSWGYSVVDELAAGAGKPLTPLELFYAIAPETAVPHPRLVQQHSELAPVLGRADDSILRVRFDSKQTRDKLWTPASCASSILGPVTWNWTLALNDQTSVDRCTNFGTNSSSCLGWVHTSEHRAGVCNNGSVSVTTSSFGQNFGGGWIASNPPFFFVSPNTRLYWSFIPALNSNLTDFVLSKMRMVATLQSGTFHSVFATR